jgi:dTDP-4-amino-4,6-dideoxygalactose transaminase
MQLKQDWSDGIYHLFVVTTEQKDEFVQHLANNNIVAAFHYPVPCHLQKAYTYLNYKRGDFPNSEYLADHCVSLPMYAELTDEEVNHVIASINKF